jgi:hypothetical protein
MNRIVRRRLEMAIRVRDFSRAHPAADASYAAVVARLEDRIARMEAVAKQQQSGYLAAHSAVTRRRALRRRLHHELLRHLVTVAEAADAEQPGLGERFKVPSASASHEAFRTLSRQMLEQGQAQKELLAKHGLAEGLLPDLAAAVDEFDGSVVASNEGRRSHVGARAELEAVSDEVMQIVELLDGLNRYRFSGEAEMRAAWESARNVVSGPSAAGEETVKEGEVKPAA